MAPKKDPAEILGPGNRDPTRDRVGSERESTNEGSRQKIDINHALLLECIEDSGIAPDFASMAHRRGISKDAMRMRYNRLRTSIYAATTVPDDSPDTSQDTQRDKAKIADEENCTPEDRVSDNQH